MPVRQNSLKQFVFSEENQVESSTNPTWLSLNSIIFNSSQPRRYFDTQKLKELTESIIQYGILEPLLVRPINNSSNQYELVAGERRYKAAISAGLTQVPVTVRSLSDREALTIALVENLQREDLNPVEETEGILQLLSFHLDISIDEVIANLYRMRNESSGTVSQNVLTNEVGKTIQSVFKSLGLLSWESFITSRLPLLKLPSELLEALRKGQISYTKVMAISKVKDFTQRQNLLTQSVEENLSLSQIKEQIRYLEEPLTLNNSLTPQKTLDNLNSRLKKSKIWKNSRKWRKLQTLLKKIDLLLEEDR
ncbi:ParB/RepB/Spo0J family partition protein [Crocosphaera sp. Alani8]|uniref:ParB/RepB/Spo0J family partition protein n=1 Tax=Crocosphaera sp. Alani8 TaxID=3038952 RepID=UPI00313F377D